MTPWQKAIKYCAIGLAVILCVSIIGGILSAVGLFGGLFTGDGVLDEAKVYSVSQDILSLEIKVNAADLEIRFGDKFSVESNLEYLTVEEKDGTLEINENTKNTWGVTYNDASLIVYMPSGYSLNNVKIVTGAGRFSVDSLSAEKMHLELGAGEVDIEELNVSSSADIDGGAGEITIRGGVVNNLDLDMGVGELDLTSALLGKNELDYGIGEASLTLIGTQDDYRITFDKGIGSATIDGEDMKDGGVYGNGASSIDISGGVGEVSIEFKTKAES